MTTLKTLLVILVGALAIGLVAPLPAGAADAGPRPFVAVLDGAFAFGACPDGAPTGAQCLTDEVTGRVPGIGPVTGTFEVVFDVGAFVDQCGPIRKRGSLVARNGDRLDIEAVGTFCFTNNIAVYVFTITDGTGRFEGAAGEGAWYVPAPTTFDGSAGTGREYLYGSATLR